MMIELIFLNTVLTVVLIEQFLYCLFNPKPTNFYVNIFNIEVA